MAEDEGNTEPNEQDVPETGADKDSDGWEESQGKGGKNAVLAELAQARRELKAERREREKIEKANMTAHERAVEEARNAGRTEAQAKAAPRLIRAEFRAAAVEAGLDKDTLAAYLEDVDLSRFLTEEGEPDEKAIAKRIERLAGAGSRRGADFEGGARRSPERPKSMTDLIRERAGITR